MKKFHLLLALALILRSLSGYGQEINVLTYNIKYDNVNDTVNNWNDRKADMVKLLEHYKPGIIGMQEVLDNQLIYLNENLPNFTVIGVGREDGMIKGEFSPILFDTTQYKRLQSETFWLSETPDKVSVGWDAALERICTYALFEDIKTQQRFWVFNTHFDHKGTVARKKSAELIVSKITDMNKASLPVILMGDLNLKPEETPIQFLGKALRDGQVASTRAFYGPTGTFNGFQQDKVLSDRIDYIFVHDFEVTSYIHIDDRMQNNKHISDHLPVMAKLTIK